jgi:hypothetical protein
VNNKINTDVENEPILSIEQFILAEEIAKIEDVQGITDEGFNNASTEEAQLEPKNVDIMLPPLRKALAVGVEDFSESVLHNRAYSPMDDFMFAVGI